MLSRFPQLCGEGSWLTEAQGEKHYMMGGKPGFYPSIKKAGVPHPVPFDLFDPFGFSKNASPEKKAKGLIAEINNGRLAMCANTSARPIHACRIVWPHSGLTAASLSTPPQARHHGLPR